MTEVDSELDAALRRVLPDILREVLSELRRPTKVPPKKIDDHDRAEVSRKMREWGVPSG